MISTSNSLVRPALYDPFPFLFAAETTRHGGVSQAPFSSLNLGNFTEDHESHILENRRRVLESAGFELNSLVFARQVHSDRIFIAEKAGIADGYDALITGCKGLMLGITVADCTPILVYDKEKEVVAAIHAGWKGTVAGIVAKTLSAMQSHFGSSGKDCFAYIGTCIDECDFEVGEEVAEQFAIEHKQFYNTDNKYHVNLKAANRQQLLDFGIPDTQIELSPRSTFTNVADYFSYRAENGMTGRFMGLIGMRAVLILLAFLVSNAFSGALSAQSTHQLLKEGNAKYEAGDFEGAEKAYNHANELGFSNGKGNYNLGNTAFQLKQYTTALDYYSKALKELWVDKDKANAYFNMGNTYFIMEEYTKSLEQFKQALRLNPNDMDAKKNLGLCQKKLQNEQKKPRSDRQAQKEQQQKNTAEKNGEKLNDQQIADIKKEQERLLKVIAEEDRKTTAKSRKNEATKQQRSGRKEW